MQFKKIVVMLASLALIGFMSQAVAQDEEENDRLARVAYITAKDGHAKKLEEAITAYHHYMGDKDGAWRYQWYSVVTGPNTGKYIARSGNHNWADFDATNDWDEAAGEKFAAEVQPHIADIRMMITSTDDELGIWPDSMKGYDYVSVTNWHVKQGHGKEFNDGLKKIDATLKAAGTWPNFYGVGYIESGGKGNTVMLVSPKKSFADMAPKEPKFMDIMKEAMGEEEAAAFMSEWATSYSSGQNQLLKYRADLSDYGDK